MFIRCEILMAIMFILGATMFNGLSKIVGEIRETMMYMENRRASSRKKEKEEFINIIVR